MASLSNQSFFESPLVIWAQTFSSISPIENVTDFADGVVFHEMMFEIDPTYFSMALVHRNVYGDVNLRINNLQLLLRSIKSYYQEKLQGIILIKMPDTFIISHEPKNELSLEEIQKILLFILGCAVQCDKKEIFIDKIKELDVEIQGHLVKFIKEVTETPDNICSYRFSDADLSTEYLLQQMSRLASERDEYAELITQLQQEHAWMSQPSEESGSISPSLSFQNGPPSPTSPGFKISPILMANKEKLRMITMELEEKNMMVSDMREELTKTKESVTRLKQNNKVLSEEARWAKAYRDEVDVLNEKAEKVSKLETDVLKYKEKLREVDYLRKRVEELKEQNDILYETKAFQEEQIKDLKTKLNVSDAVEDEIRSLKRQIQAMTEEREFEQNKLKQLMEENAQFEVDKQNSVGELAAITVELDTLRSQAGGALGTTLANECNESSSTSILKLERENRGLLKSLEESSNMASKYADMQKSYKEMQQKMHDNRMNMYDLNEELVKEKTKTEQQGKEIERLSSALTKMKMELEFKTKDMMNMSGEIEIKHREVELLQSENMSVFQQSEAMMDQTVKFSHVMKEKDNIITELRQELEDNQRKFTDVEKRLAFFDTQRQSSENLAKSKEQELDELQFRIQEVSKSQQAVINKTLKRKDKEIAELKLRMDEMASEKDMAADEVLRKKEQEVRDLRTKLQQAVTQKELEVDEVLEAKDREAESIRTRLEAVKGQKEKLDKELKEKDQLIFDLQSRIDEMSYKTQRWEEIVKKKDSEIITLQDEIGDALETNKALNYSLKLKSDKVTELDNRMEEILSTHGKTNEIINKKDNDFNDIQIRLEEIIVHKQKLEETVRRKEYENADLQHMLEDTVTEKQQTGEKSRKKDKEITDLQQNLEDVIAEKQRSDEILRKKDKDLLNFESRLEQVTEENEGLAEDIKSKDQKILVLEKRIREMVESVDQNNERLSQTMREKEKQVKELNRRIEEIKDAFSEIDKLNQLMKQKDVKIDNLNKEIQAKERQLLELDSKYEDVVNDNKKLTHSVKLKEKRIVVLESSLAETEASSVQLKGNSEILFEKNLEAKDNRMIELETRLQEVMGNTSRLQHAIKVKDERIVAQENKLEEIEALTLEKNRLNQSIEHKLKKILELETRYDEVTSENQRLLHSSEQKEEKVRSLEQRFREMETLVQESENKLHDSKQKDDKITSLSKALQKKEKKLIEVENSLDDALNEKSKLAHNLKMKEEKLQLLDSRVLELGEMTKQTEKMMQQMQQKEDKIKTLEEKLEEFDDVSRQNAKLTSSLKNKEEKIRVLQDRLDELNDSVSMNEKLNQTVKQKEDKIKILEARNDELEDFINQKEMQYLEFRELAEDRIKELDKRTTEHDKTKLQREQSLKRREYKIRTLESRLEESIQEQEGLQTQVKELDHVSNQTIVLSDVKKRQEEKLKLLEASVQDKERTLNRVESILKQRESKIETLEKRLEDAEQALEDAEQALEDSEKISKSIKQKENKIIMLSQSSEQQKSEIMALEQRLQLSTAKEIKLKQVHEQKEDIIQTLKTKLEESESHNHDLGQDFQLKDDKIQALEKSVQDKERTLNRVEGILKQRESKIETLEKKLEDAEQALEDSEKISKSIKQKESKINMLSQSSEQQESEILALEQRLQLSTAKATKLKQVLEQKEDRIQTLKTKLEESVSHNHDLGLNVQLKDDKIQALEKRLTSADDEISRLTKELGAAGKKFGKVQQVFVPKDAKRETSKLYVDLQGKQSMLEKQNSTLRTQNAAMSSENAALQSEIESLQSELSSVKSEHESMLGDLNETREHYNELDMSATKIAHRCEMLVQLNATLEEENKTLKDHVDKLMLQNHEILLKTLESKDQFMEGERAFTDRVYSLQRQKERLEEQIDAANKAIAQMSTPKKRSNILKKVLRKTGLSKKKDEPRRSNVQLINKRELEGWESQDALSETELDSPRGGRRKTHNESGLGLSKQFNDLRSPGTYQRPLTPKNKMMSLSSDNLASLRVKRGDNSDLKPRHFRSQYIPNENDFSPKSNRSLSMDASVLLSETKSAQSLHRVMSPPLSETIVQTSSSNLQSTPLDEEMRSERSASVGSRQYLPRASKEARSTSPGSRTTPPGSRTTPPGSRTTPPGSVVRGDTVAGILQATPVRDDYSTPSPTISIHSGSSLGSHSHDIVPVKEERSYEQTDFGHGSDTSDGRVGTKILHLQVTEEELGDLKHVLVENRTPKTRRKQGLDSKNNSPSSNSASDHDNAFRTAVDVTNLASQKRLSSSSETDSSDMGQIHNHLKFSSYDRRRSAPVDLKQSRFEKDKIGVNSDLQNTLGTVVVSSASIQLNDTTDGYQVEPRPRALNDEMRPRSNSAGRITCRRHLEYKSAGASSSFQKTDTPTVPQDSPPSDSVHVVLRNKPQERVAPRPRPMSAGRTRPVKEEFLKRKTIYESSTTRSLNLEQLSPVKQIEITPIKSESSTSPEMIIEVRPRRDNDLASPPAMRQPPPYRPPPNAPQNKKFVRGGVTGKESAGTTSTEGKDGTRFTIVGRRTPDKTPEKNDTRNESGSNTPTPARKGPSVWYDYGSV